MSATKLYTNNNDNGKDGRNAEIALREAVAEALGASILIKAIKSANKSDLKIKTAKGAILSIECKTGCGWLTPPTFTEDEAKELLSNLQALKKAIAHTRYIAYAPTAQEDMLVMPKATFIDICANFGILRVKRHSSGNGYGVTIQSYIPTPTFRASKERYQAIVDALFDNGEYIDCFLDRVDAIEILDEVRA